MNSNPMMFASLQEATGALPYNMTNDYMFRAVLQSNNKVLCGLIRALLHLSEDISLTAEITNPIVLGEAIHDKEFRLDINVIINQSSLLNLEMQVADKLNWPNRSLSYLCRSFDQLNQSEEYQDIKPVIHIGFLDYTLFKESPEFYASYKMMNTKNHHIYSDNFEIRVVNLTQIELATDEDKQYQIDYWAALFKSETWEDIKMLAEKNEYINEASKSIFQMTADELVRKRCRDREDYYSSLRSYERTVAQQANTITRQDEEIALLKQRIAELEQAYKDK